MIIEDITMMELRRSPGKYLDLCDYQDRSFRLFRNGKLKAALIPYRLYKLLKEDRK